MNETTLDGFKWLVKNHTGPIDLIVGPEIMREVLASRAGGDRPLNNTKIANYVADMDAGRWRPVGDPITFDTSGIRTNGQHRAEAVIRYGKPVLMPFRFNAPPDVYSLHDVGSVRSLGDVMVANGIGKELTPMMGTSGTRIAAVMQLLMLIELNQTSKLTSAHRVEIRYKIEDFYKGHEEHLRWFSGAVSAMNSHKVGRKASLLATPIIAAWVMLHGLCDTTSLEGALRRYLSGSGAEDGDPITLLRTYALNERTARSSGNYAAQDANVTAFAKAATAIEGSADGRKMMKLIPPRDLASFIKRLNERRIEAGLYSYSEE